MLCECVYTSDGNITTKSFKRRFSLKVSTNVDSLLCNQFVSWRLKAETSHYQQSCLSAPFLRFKINGKCITLSIFYYGISLLMFWYHCADDRCIYNYNEYDFIYLTTTDRLIFHNYTASLKKINLNPRNREVFWGNYFFVRNDFRRKWNKQFYVSIYFPLH